MKNTVVVGLFSAMGFAVVNELLKIGERVDVFDCKDKKAKVYCDAINDYFSRNANYNFIELSETTTVTADVCVITDEELEGTLKITSNYTLKIEKIKKRTDMTENTIYYHDCFGVYMNETNSHYHEMLTHTFDTLTALSFQSVHAKQLALYALDLIQEPQYFEKKIMQGKFGVQRIETNKEDVTIYTDVSGNFFENLSKHLQQVADE
ncbi:MAG: hypothetical protein ACRCWQ_10665 [Bacilli bacterium]